jgi:hypothetical protein
VSYPAFFASAAKLLLIKGLPRPRSDGYEYAPGHYDPYLTKAEYQRLCNVVCERLPWLTAKDWWDAGQDQRTVLLRDALRRAPSTTPEKPTAAETPKGRKTGKPKKTECPKADLIIAALVKHHEYGENCSCLNYEPATVRGLAKQLGFSTATVKRFFDKRFGEHGHARYKTRCAKKEVGQFLGRWLGELPSYERELPGHI